MFAARLRKLPPFRSRTSQVIRSNETLAGFVWRASGPHQFYVGLIAIAVALFNLAPIDLQRRIIDEAIGDRDMGELLFLGAVYLGIVLMQGVLKFVLFFYQGWVGESCVKTARDQIAAVASERPPREDAMGGDRVNVIGREIDNVGGFVGTSISEFVVNLTLLLLFAGYMLYVEPVIALVGAVALIPQIFLAVYMQADLNRLVERQVGLVRRLGDETISTDLARGSFATIRRIYHNRIRFYLLKYGLKTLLSLANAMGPLMVLLVGGYLVIEGQTTVGTIVAFVSGLERVSSPLHDLLNFYRAYEQAKVQHQMIVEWVEEEPAA
jgi:ABC-type bacteriocin/lantibiotic exporter with double-glycine peptidase domain